MKTKVVGHNGSVYEYHSRLADQLVRLGRARYLTRDMQAGEVDIPEPEQTDREESQEEQPKRKPGRPRKQADSE